MSKYKINKVEFILLFLLVIYPVVFTTSYTNISDAKYLVFMFCSITMYFLYALKTIHKNIDINNYFKPSLKNVWLNLSIMDKVMLFYLFINILSVVISDYKIEAMTGSCNNNMGLIYVFGTVMVYFSITRCCKNRFLVLAAMGIGLSIIVFSAVLQFYGFDLFGLLSSIDEVEQINYLSFFGNTNIYCSYLCLITPAFMMGYVFSENKNHGILYLSMSVVGFIGLFTANTDSGYFGYFAGFLMIFFIATGRRERLYKLVKLGLAFFISATIFGFFYSFTAHRLIDIVNVRSLSSITRFMTCSHVPFAATIIFIIFTVLFNFVVVSDKTFYAIKSSIRALLLCLFIVILILIIYINFLNPEDSYGYFDNYFKFSGEWGTGRGYVWRWSIEIFKEAPILNKILGFGVGTCGIELLSSYSDIMHYELGYYFTNAHNEFLEILINCGLFGVLSYIILTMSTVVKGIKSKDFFNIIIAVAIVTYCIQSSFVVMQPIVNPLMFVFIALGNLKMPEEINKKEESYE